MSENDAPKELDAKETLALTMLVVLVGGLLFAAFSFLTFGVPLLVVALAGIIWMYVGIMKWVDRTLMKRDASEPISPPAAGVSRSPRASSRGGEGGDPQ